MDIFKNNKIKNTWSFGPTLLQNSEVKTARTDINKRNGLCQVNRNNFIIFTGTSRNGYSYTQEAEIFKSLGCKTAYGLDGGDSVSLVYKKNGQTKSTVQYCNDTYGGSRSSSTTHCRYIVEGVYFVEK